MKTAVYLLNSLALVLQLVGAWLVIQDIRQAQDNLAAFKDNLDDAASKRSDHLAQMESMSGREVPSPIGYGTIRLPQIPGAAREALANQVGPSAAIEREALTDFVEAQFSISKSRRWSGAGLLVAGVIVGYLANMLSVS